MKPIQMTPIDKLKREQVGTYLQHMIPFNAGSARGRVMRRSNLYEVWSYNILIGRVDIATRDVLYFDDTDYSATTSFIQRKFREAFIGIQAFAPEE